MHGLYLLWWVGERGISPAIVAMIVAAGDLTILSAHDKACALRRHAHAVMRTLKGALYEGMTTR